MVFDFTCFVICTKSIRAITACSPNLSNWAVSFSIVFRIPFVKLKGLKAVTISHFMIIASTLFIISFQSICHRPLICQLKLHTISKLSLPLVRLMILALSDLTVGSCGLRHWDTRRIEFTLETHDSKWRISAHQYSQTQILPSTSLFFINCG